MNALTTFKTAGLPKAADLAAGLRDLKNVAKASSGGAIVKMDKTGTWVVGSGQEPIAENTEWAVNPYSFVKGYIAWSGGEVAGETMVPMSEAMPDPGPTPVSRDPDYKGWQINMGFGMASLEDEDGGMTVSYSATSHGGKSAIAALAAKITDQIDVDPGFPVPIVVLESESYVHKKYGKTWNPKFEVVGWMSMDGEEKDLDEVEPEPEPVKPAPAAAPTRRRPGTVARAPEPAPEPEVEMVDDEPTDEQLVEAVEDTGRRQRRRPARA